MRVGPARARRVCSTADAEIKKHTRRSVALTSDTHLVTFDEPAISLDAFAAKLRAQPGVAAVELK